MQRPNVETAVFLRMSMLHKVNMLAREGSELAEHPRMRIGDVKSRHV